MCHTATNSFTGVCRSSSETRVDPLLPPCIRMSGWKSQEKWGEKKGEKDLGLDSEEPQDWIESEWQRGEKGVA